MAVTSVDGDTGMVRREWLWREALTLGWLVFALFPILDVFRQRPSVGRAVAVICADAAFVAGYVSISWWRSKQSSRRTTVTLLAMGIIVAALTLIDQPSWIWLSIFVVVGVATNYPSSIAGRLIWAVAGAAFAVGWTAGTGVNLLSLLIMTVGIGYASMHTRNVFVTNASLRRSQGARARLAVAEERLRFARDLHDLLGHSLSVIALKSEVAERVVSSEPERAAEEMRHVGAVAREALKEVRDAVTGYRQATISLELAGARTTLRSAGIECDEDVEATPIPPDVEAVMAWAIREGVTNVVRHSGARRCWIRVAAVDGAAVATVLDDGVGSSSVNGSAGNGLTGLAERAKAVGGSLQAGPGPGGGFELRVSVPLVEFQLPERLR